MKKHVIDTSFAEDDYMVPENVRSLVADIERQAQATYPDHAESRRNMVRQELINELSQREGQLDNMRRAADKLLKSVSSVLPHLEASAQPKPWWKVW